MERFHLYG